MRLHQARLLPALALWLALRFACATVVPPHIAAELPDARLAGSGTYRWFGLRIYDAELWVGPRGYQAEAESFALDLRYGRSFSGKKIAERSVLEMENLGLGSVEQRRNWLAQMQACFPDVDEGTHLTGIFRPSVGVSYFRDGKVICAINDTQFAAAFFAIWLDPHTSAPSLRAALLGQGK
jgi:hypothetical protein